jgi:hypothetical protein
MKEKIISAIALIFMITPSVALAEETDSWTGSIGLGAIVINNANNLNPEGSQKRLDNLDSAADPETTLLPAILPEVTWDAGQPDGFKFYLATDPPIEEVGGFALNIGTTYNTGKAGILNTSVFFTPFEKAWENPYLTGVNRKETDTTKYGFRIGLNRIMDTGFRAQFVYLNDDVDDDAIGKLVPGLARDGAVYSLNLNYSHYVGNNLELRPRFSIRTGDYDGEANSFMKYKVDLEARYMTGKWMIIPRVFYSHSDFEERDPIFDKTRKNDSYGASLMTTYMAPFNWEKWSATCLLSISRGDSNIDFYDTESATIGGVLTYHF